MKSVCDVAQKIPSRLHNFSVRVIQACALQLTVVEDPELASIHKTLQEGLMGLDVVEVVVTLLVI
jgi:hypothetical protein